ncbi:hypothetical protein BDN70DRAFT_938717 [Pholiota conissans]|uniref:Uncharacterized protein n=1 Tax=Pholiota conissans TaxID=109636 RepID=A0A9P6CT47_9AGAR|nr:hypothetical protein BDN70DRAFT_938717 [Pholiota conissans]
MYLITYKDDIRGLSIRLAISPRMRRHALASPLVQAPPPSFVPLSLVTPVADTPHINRHLKFSPSRCGHRHVREDTLSSRSRKASRILVEPSQITSSRSVLTPPFPPIIPFTLRPFHISFASPSFSARCLAPLPRSASYSRTHSIVLRPCIAPSPLRERSIVWFSRPAPVSSRMDDAESMGGSCP